MLGKAVVECPDRTNACMRGCSVLRLAYWTEEPHRNNRPAKDIGDILRSLLLFHQRFLPRRTVILSVPRAFDGVVSALCDLCGKRELHHMLAAQSGDSCAIALQRPSARCSIST